MTNICGLLGWTAERKPTLSENVGLYTFYIFIKLSSVQTKRRAKMKHSISALTHGKARWWTTYGQGCESSDVCRPAVNRSYTVERNGPDLRHDDVRDWWRHTGRWKRGETWLYNLLKHGSYLVFAHAGSGFYTILRTIGLISVSQEVNERGKKKSECTSTKIQRKNKTCLSSSLNCFFKSYVFKYI